MDESVIQFFMDRAEMFDEYLVEVERLWANDNQVLAFIRVRGSGQGSGASSTSELGTSGPA